MSYLSRMKTEINRTDGVGLAYNVGIPIVASLLLNGLIFKAGWDHNSSQERSDLLPPAPVIGGIWVGLLGAMGAARWSILRAKQEGASTDANLIAALIGSSLAYPLYTQAFKQKKVSFFGSILTAVAGSLLSYRLKKHSKLAAALVAPTVPWVTYASVGVLDEIRNHPEVQYLH